MSEHTYTPEETLLVDRCRDRDASAADLLALALIEIRDACENIAKGKDGLFEDQFHAGCCVSRVESYLTRIQKMTERN